MNRSIKIIGFLIVILTTLLSCTNEEVQQIQPPLLKKIVEVAVDGTSNSTILVYNQNKIVSIDKVDAKLEFFYTGSLITKIVETKKSNAKITTLDYYYSNEQLETIISSDNFVINYVYNDDGSVSYEKLKKDSNNNKVKIHHGILYFNSGNLSKDDRIINTSDVGVIETSSFSQSYDVKNNPLNGILGINKLLDYSQTISLNNVMTSIEIYTVKKIAEDQITSSINKIDSKYEYNSIGYPTQILSEKVIFGNPSSKHFKTLLFYN